MFEEDFIMRQIREMVRMMLKLLFQIDLDSNGSWEEVFQGTKETDILRELFSLVDAGRIDRAENQVYELCEDPDAANLKIVLMFYDYLNGKEDEFLEQCGFSREEIKEDLKDLVSKFGLSDMAETFLHEN